MARQTPRPRKAKNNGRTNKPHDPLLRRRGQLLARCSTSDPSTSETRDGNGKPRRNKDRRWAKDKNPKSRQAMPASKAHDKIRQNRPPQDNRDDPSNLNKILDRICQIHSTPRKPANHTHRDCWVFKQSGRLNALGMTPRSDMNPFIQTPSFAASEAAMYSTSHVDPATTLCLPIDNSTVQYKHYPVCDLESSGSVSKLAST